MKPALPVARTTMFMDSGLRRNDEGDGGSNSRASVLPMTPVSTSVEKRDFEGVLSWIC
jgi:hypothetical protein